MSDEKNTVNGDFNEYRRLILKELETGHETDEKQWEQIRKIDGNYKEFKSNVEIRLDRLERSERIKMWLLRLLLGGMVTLLGKLVYDWITGS